MNELFQLLIRQGLTLLSAALAAHHFDDVSSTGGIVLAVLLFVLATAWSWIAKALHIEDKYGDLTTNASLRTLLGSLISQGITFLSGYFSIDASDPNLLCVALVNTIASRYGVHQQIAHATPLAVATAIKVLLVSSLVGLVSCATTAAILTSPFGRAVIATSDQLAKQVVITTEETGLEQIILQASAKVSALNAEGVTSDIVKETLRLSEIAGFQAVISAAQDKYQAFTGHAFTLPKNPVKVTVAAVKPRLKRPKPTLQSSDVPGCMQLADRIPVYGERVAFMLSTGAVK